MDIEAFYTLSYGLYIVTSAKGEKQNGYIANTVFQVTADPPKVAVSCSKDNHTADIIRTSGAFGVSVLDRDAPPALIGLFGFSSGKTKNKFGQTKTFTHDGGIPLVTEYCISWFICQVEQTVDLGTHLIFIGEVMDAQFINKQGQPLTYADYREKRKGLAPKNAPTYIDPEKLKKQKEANARFRCPVCGYIYIPEAGDPEGGIRPGTPFSELPSDWQCPICGVGKEEFEIVK